MHPGVVGTKPKFLVVGAWGLKGVHRPSGLVYAYAMNHKPSGTVQLLPWLP